MTKNICLNGRIKMSPLRGFIGGVNRMGYNIIIPSGLKKSYKVFKNLIALM
jgi:hypothetical protein